MADEPTSREGAWPDAAGTGTLWYRSWLPASYDRVLLFLHGFGEHSGRYASLARRLTASGLGVVAVDLHGHGRSSGRRGDTDRFSRYLDDVELILERHLSSVTAPDVRPILAGHSFGGLVAVHMALRAPRMVPRLIVQSPLLQVGFPVPAWKEHAARWLTWWPTLSLQTGLDPRGLSHDPAIVEAYRRDPQVHGRITVRAYHELHTAMAQAQDGAARVQPPTLLLFGAEDPVVSATACRDFGQRLQCPHRVVEYPGCYHELHHERVAQEVAAAIAEWSRSDG